MRGTASRRQNARCHIEIDVAARQGDSDCFVTDRKAPRQDRRKSELGECCSHRIFRFVVGDGNATGQVRPNDFERNFRGVGALRASQIVCPPGSLLTRRSRVIDFAICSKPIGSTAYIAVAGDNALSTRAQPDVKPPPEQQTQQRIENGTH